MTEPTPLAEDLPRFARVPEVRGIALAGADCRADLRRALPRRKLLQRWFSGAARTRDAKGGCRTFREECSPHFERN